MPDEILIKDTTVLAPEFGWTTKRGHLYINRSERYGYRFIPHGDHINEDKTGWVIDGSKKIYMPSFFNAHTHLPMILFRGLAEDAVLEKWLTQKIRPLERGLKSRDIEIATLAAGIELIKGGTCHVITTYYYPTASMKALSQLGIFAMVGISIMDDPPFDYDGLNLAEKLLVKPKSMEWEQQYILAPHSIYRCSDNTLQRVIDLAKRFDTYITIHVSETRWECVDSWRRFKRWPVEHLHDIRFLGPKVLLTHSSWLTKMEISLIKNTDTKVVHCPISNMKLASGATMPLIELLNENVNVFLGTDSPASNNSLYMSNEIKFCSLVHKSHRWDATVISAKDVLTIACSNKRKIFPFEAWIGIEKESIRLRPFIPERLPIHIVFSGIEVVDMLSPTSGPIMLNRTINTVDEDMVVAEFDRIIADMYGG